jgi:hypothetical protein
MHRLIQQTKLTAINANLRADSRVSSKFADHRPTNNRLKKLQHPKKEMGASIRKLLSSMLKI